MGDLFVGKTCLIRKLISNTFAPRYVSTGGGSLVPPDHSIFFRLWCVKHLNFIAHIVTEEHKQKYRLGLSGKSYILRLTDTSGMMPLDSLTKEVRFAFLPLQL
jgi:GTPase SAR1 family protein